MMEMDEIRERPILFSGEMVRAILDGSKTQTRRLGGLQDVNRYPGVLQGESPLGTLGYRGLEVTDYNLKPSEKRIFRNNPGIFHWFLGEQPSKNEINPIPVKCPYGKPGDLLWVRETWKIGAWREDGRMAIDYRASPDLTHTPWVTIPDDGGDKFQDIWIDLTDQLIAMEYPMNPDTERYEWEPGQCPLPWRPSIFIPRWASRITLQIASIRVERLQDITYEDAVAEGTLGVGLVGANIAMLVTGTNSLDAAEKEMRLASFAGLWDSINAKRGYPWEINPWVWVIEFEHIDKEA